MGFQKRPHMKLRLRELITRRFPVRATPPRTAARIHAIRAFGTGEMADASGHIIAGDAERAYGTGIQARFIRASITRSGTLISGWQRQPFGKRQRSPITMPKPLVWVYEHAERRRLARFGLLRPALKRQIRFLKRKQRERAKRLRQWLNDITRPVIQQIDRRVARRAECRPHGRPGVTGQNQRTGLPAVGKFRHAVFRFGVEGASRRQSRLLQRIVNVRQGPGHVNASARD